MDKFYMPLREDLPKKNVYFRALPKLALPPPIRATWSSFSGRQKRRFARMTGKNLMLIMKVAMIIMMIIMVILMIIMTKMTKKHTITVKFE